MDIRLAVSFCIIAAALYIQPEVEGAQTGQDPGSGSADRSADISSAVEVPQGVLFGEFSAGDGPLLLKGSVIVPSGEQLVLNPGVKIYVGGEYSTITVFGQLIVHGSEGRPVVFQSAKNDPEKWDWDRIYIRSRKLSTLNHCIVKHSNYGLYIENSRVKIKGMIFEKNSIHGMVVKNSTVNMWSTVFKGGHVGALFCSAGADVSADSCSFTYNNTGVICAPRTTVRFRNSEITDNSRGVILSDSSDAEFIGSEITKNRFGVVSVNEIKRSSMEMVFDNNRDIKIVPKGQLEEFIKPPQEVKSVSLPEEKTTVTLPDDFSGGFRAVKRDMYEQTSFIGNIEFGARYFNPDSRSHPRDTSTGGGDTVYTQTRYPGEHGDKWYDGMQPEISVFAQGKRGIMDIDLNTEVYGNTWIDNEVRMKPELLSLNINIGNQNLKIGDFYENISELSMAGRKASGFRAGGTFGNMGRGTKRFEYILAGGQTEVPQDTGDNEEDIFGSVIDSGSSERQQLTYIASLSGKIIPSLEIQARGIIAHDQINNGIGDVSVIEDSDAPEPLSAQTGAVEITSWFLDNSLELGVEVNMGVHDTVDTADYDEIKWYRPHIPRSILNVIEEIDPDSNNYAVQVYADWFVKGFDLSAVYREIGGKFFSAGNPYLDNNRREIALGGEKEWNKSLKTVLYYSFERTGLSYRLKQEDEQDLVWGDQARGPMNTNTASLRASYDFGEYSPLVSGEYTLSFEKNSFIEEISTDTSDTEVVTDYKNLENKGVFEVRQSFENGIDYRLKYRLRRINDMTGYADKDDIDNDDEWRHSGGIKFGFNLFSRIRNKLTLTGDYSKENRDNEVERGFRVSDDFRIKIVPRKLTAYIEGEYDRDWTEQDVSETHPWKRTQEISKELSFELKYGITSTLSLRSVYEYKDVYDESSYSSNYSVNIAGLYLSYVF